MGNLRVNQPVSRSPLDLDVIEFMLDRQARRLSPRTIEWYRESLAIFRAFLAEEEIGNLAGVTASVLRRFLVGLDEGGHNAGGIRNIFGAVRALINWYADEHAPDGWTNPLRRIKLPKAGKHPLPPVELETVRLLLAACQGRGLTAARDRAVLLCLLDSGARAAEFLALNVGDINLSTGAVKILHGKGDKERVTFLGARARRELVRYLRLRPTTPAVSPLWITDEGDGLTYSGLREIMRRRAKSAGVPAPALHSFRRAFAIGSKRAGADLVSLQRMLGHSDLSVLNRYLAQTEEDLREVHEKSSPVDGLL